MKKVEADIKNYEAECKKIQSLKESSDANNDMKLKRKNETSDYIERLKNDIENEKRNKDHNEFALENLKKEITNLNAKKEQAENEIKKLEKEMKEYKQSIDNEKSAVSSVQDEFKILKEQETKNQAKLDELKRIANTVGKISFNSKKLRDSI